jgi:hypothetical protein
MQTPRALQTTALAACVLAVLAGCADMGKVKPQAVALKPAELNAGKAIAAASANVAWPEQQWCMTRS